MDGVGLGEEVTVEEDVAGMEVDAVSGDSDDALDQVFAGVDRVVEDDDVAVAEVGGREEG